MSGTADYWIYTLGDLDTVGELQDSSGDPIASDDYGAVLPNPDNFFLWRKLQSGAYYIKVNRLWIYRRTLCPSGQAVHGHHFKEQRSHSEHQRLRKRHNRP